MELEKKIFVTGHRNPDVDSLAAATALAELRRRQGMKNVFAVSPGVPSERARWLFERFKQKLPPTYNDLHLRIRDIMEENCCTIPAGTPLFLAVKELHRTGIPRLPVVNAEKQYLGMLSPLALLSKWLNTEEEELTTKCKSAWLRSCARSRILASAEHSSASRAPTSPPI